MVPVRTDRLRCRGHAGVDETWRLTPIILCPSPTTCGTAAKPSLLRGSLRSLLRMMRRFLGDLILRCEGEARASKDEVARYATLPQLVGEGGEGESPSRVRAPHPPGADAPAPLSRSHGRGPFS